MKLYSFLWIFILQQTYSRACPFADLLDPVINLSIINIDPNPGPPTIENLRTKAFKTITSQPLCMNAAEIILATKYLCDTYQVNNVTLWKQIHDCHSPIDDPFLRQSNEARCPIPRLVDEPRDTNFPMSDVFFNLCGLVRGNVAQLTTTLSCFILGDRGKGIPDRATEVDTVRRKYGNDVPCNIGICCKRVLSCFGIF